MPSILHTGLVPTRAVLDNGVVVIVKHTGTTPSATISLAVRNGSICDPPDASGAFHLLSRVIDRGTARRSADEIAEDLDSRGVALNANVARHVTLLVCSSLSEDFYALLELLGDILMFPALPERELETRRREVITTIRQDEDNPSQRALDGVMALLYPDPHPYGRRTKGTLDSVERLRRDRLARLHAERYTPSDLIAVIVGDVDVNRALEAVARVFGTWRRPAPAPIQLEHVRPPSRRRCEILPMMNKAQAEIAYGFTTVPRQDPAFDAFRLMNNAFGQYALGGRLGDSIRERQGMAYYAFSLFDPCIIETPLIVRAGVSPANVDRTIASIDEEVARLARDGLTEKEVSESRQYLIGSLPRTLETNVGIASFLQIAEFFGLGLDYDVRMADRLGAVTLEDVNAAARTLDPERASIVIAGPYEKE
jgi:zinc protease